MKTLPSILSHPLVERAYLLAVRAHEGQFRRDGVTPYIEHIQQVMLRTPDDPVLQMVAALHDVIEDHPVRWVELAVFPAEAQAGVVALTRGEGETYEAFIQRIKTTDGGRFVPVKVADNLANLADSPTQAQIVRYARSLLTLLS